MCSFDMIYDSMCGFLVEEYALPDVNNAFVPGSYCDRQYERMRSAYERVCDRLKTGEEDPDLNIMVEAMENIQRELCRRIFYYAKEG